MARIREIFNYRDMIFSLVRRELRGRYQKSVLGMLWTLLNPLAQIAVYTFVFTVIFPNNLENYYIYLTAGLVPWTFFNESLSQGTGSIVANADMTKKIYFPREVLTISSVAAKFVNLMLAFLIVFAFILFSGIGIDFRVIWLLPVVMIAEFLTALGLTLLFSAVTVYLRDMEYIVGVFLMAWIWATPIMYTVDNLPPAIYHLLLVNPMTPIVMIYHDLLYYQSFPSVPMLLAVVIEGIALTVLGEAVFVKLEGNFAEEL